LSWFIAHLVGYCRPMRNPTLKVAGFHLPLPGRFCVPADTSMSRSEFPLSFAVFLMSFVSATRWVIKLFRNRFAPALMPRLRAALSHA
jgi:hypothetical protein